MGEIGLIWLWENSCFGPKNVTPERMLCGSTKQPSLNNWIDLLQVVTESSGQVRIGLLLLDA